MGVKVEESVRDDGSNPYQKWFDNLDALAAAKVTVAKVRLDLDNTSSVEWFRGSGEFKARKRTLADAKKGTKKFF